MNTSENINELATALCKAQSQMTGAKKSKTNPFFKAAYSDLSSVCEAISEPFADNGLSFIQSPGFDDNKITVTTRIMHDSGQWIEGVVTLPPTKNDAQGYGSAITYGRRYGLQAMAGVPSVDDDGNDAVKHKAKQIDLTDLNQALDDCTTVEEINAIWAKLDAGTQKRLRTKAGQVKQRILGAEK